MSKTELCQTPSTYTSKNRKTISRTKKYYRQCLKITYYHRMLVLMIRSQPKCYNCLTLLGGELRQLQRDLPVVGRAKSSKSLVNLLATKVLVAYEGWFQEQWISAISSDKRTKKLILFWMAFFQYCSRTLLEKVTLKQNGWYLTVRSTQDGRKI